MKFHLFTIGLVGTALIAWSHTQAEENAASTRTPLEHIQAEGQFQIPVPLSPAVKVGKLVFVSGIPAYDKTGKLAIGDFPAQMKQVMENITGILKASGAGWDRVVKVNVMLTRQQDFAEMNHIYSTYFSAANYPARSTTIVSALPRPDFLLEIDCEAVLE